MTNVSWEGVYPALTTKFTPDDKLDIPLFAASIRAQMEAGVHGIIIGGSLGEASTITIDEKKQLVECAHEVVAGKIPVILNIAESSTSDAMRMTELAAKWKVQGLMLLPPMRYAADQREALHYFKTVAASTDLPIMIYNNPVDYKIEVTIPMFEELIQYPVIQAVKESTRDVTNVTRMINRFGNRLKILCGVDTIALEALLMGADGWVAGLVNAFPVETVDIYNYVLNGKVTEALNLHRWFLPLLELDIHPKLVQYIKLAESRTGLGNEWVRAPRLPLEGRERERVLAVIDEALKKRPLPGHPLTASRPQPAL
jgi:1-pyrroline-4-hydroxy-2-carboxylate deaminase